MTNLKSKYKYNILEILNIVREQQNSTYSKLLKALPILCGVSRMTFYRWTRIPAVPKPGEKERDVPAKCLYIMSKAFFEAGFEVSVDDLVNYRIPEIDLDNPEKIGG